ncbi:MAG: hypothetical protein SGJ11_02815 [Phycisphaerae bacterium]|nr:hypothetical protein [Phycisphaerae bacterium]
MTRISCIVAAVTLLHVASGTASASVQLTVNFDLWQRAAGNTTKLDFVFDTPQVITDQYSALGVLFPDGDDYVAPVSVPPPGSDGWFLRDTWGDLQTTFVFDDLQTAIGFTAGIGHFFSLYSGDTLVYESPEFGTNPFIGAISTIPFDRVVMSRSGGGPAVDTFWFGGTVPAPGTIAVLALAFVGSRRRR